MKNLYEALGVDKKASKEEIKKAHRKKINGQHPDQGGNVYQFRAIQEAYETLYNDEKRQRYDNGEPDPVDSSAEAYNFLALLFSSIIDNRDDICFDFIEKLQDLVTNNINIVNKTKCDAEKKLKFFEEVKEKIVYKGKNDNFLIILLSQKIQGVSNSLKKADHQLEMMEIADKIIKDYDFKFEPIIKVLLILLNIINLDVI